MKLMDNFLVLDTETTGLGNDAEICQIAIIDQDGIALLNRLVKPTVSIPPDASAIHGITNADVANAPTFDRVVNLIHDLLDGQDVVIYNASYDLRMLRQSAKACGFNIDLTENARFYCAMEKFAEVYGDWNEYRQSYRWQKLSTAAAYYGVAVVAAHDALGDCFMTLGVVKKMGAL